jgi:DNA-binding transcriptional MerR regulator
MFKYLAGGNTKKRSISSAEIIKRFKISYQTLNYYTNLGLLRSLNKKGNKRYYDELELKNNLEKIQKFKNEGYPLRLIRKLLHS